MAIELTLEKAHELLKRAVEEKGAFAAFEKAAGLS